MKLYKVMANNAWQNNNSIELNAKEVHEHFAGRWVSQLLEIKALGQEASTLSNYCFSVEILLQKGGTSIT